MGAEGSPATVGSMHRPSEISNLELSINAQKQILWLDVSVDDMLGVAVDQSPCQRENVPADCKIMGVLEKSKWPAAMILQLRTLVASIAQKSRNS